VSGFLHRDRQIPREEKGPARIPVAGVQRAFSHENFLSRDTGSWGFLIQRKSTEEVSWFLTANNSGFYRLVEKLSAEKC